VGRVDDISSAGRRSGYDKQEVDAFRSAVRDTFLGGAVFWVSTPPVRSDDLRGKQFSTHRPGYDKTQVNAFLEAAGIRLAAMESTDRPAGPLVSSAILAGWAEWADSTTFSRNGWRSGYTATVVDAFLRAIRDTFRGVSEPPVRSDHVHGKQFPSTDNPGYDKTQVDAFLEAAGIRLAAMESTDRPEEPFVSSAVLAEWARWADSTRFSTTRRPTGGGYDTTEVDAFRDEVRDTFIRKRHPLLTSEEAHGKKFTLRLLRRGYKVEQVDAFFDEAEVKLAAMRRSDQGGHD
jgi:DivIVA domain-containing protein